MHHRFSAGGSGYPSPLPKGKPQPRTSKWQWRWTLLGLCAAGLALLQLVHVMQMSSTAHGNGGSRKARGGDAFGNNNLQELYGRETWARHVDGPSNLLVLGYHNTGAPLMTRLLMLMGAFAGYASELNTDADRTQGWELREVTHINALAVQPSLRPGSLPWMALGFNASTALRGSSGEYYRQRIGAVLGYLRPKQPWVTSEPLLPWLAGVWLETLEDPLCVLLYRSPRAVASELSQLQLPGVEGPGAAANLHMLRWADATLAALQSCRGVPTLVWPAQLLSPPLLEAGAPALLEHLKAAGVQGLQLPSASALQQHYLEGMGLVPSHHPTISPRAARHAAVAAAAGGARAGSNTSAGAQQPIKRPEQQLSKDYSRLQHTSDWLEMDLTGAPVSELRLGGQAAGSGDSGSSSNSVPPIEAEVLDAVLRSHLRSVVPYLQVESKYRTTSAALLKAYQTQLLATQQGGRRSGGALRRVWAAAAR